MTTIQLIPNGPLTEHDFTSIRESSIESLRTCTPADQFFLFLYHQDEHDQSIITAREHFFRPNNSTVIAAISTLAQMVAEHATHSPKLQQFAEALVDDCENLGLTIVKDN